MCHIRRRHLGLNSIRSLPLSQLPPLLTLAKLTVFRVDTASRDNSVTAVVWIQYSVEKLFILFYSCIGSVLATLPTVASLGTSPPKMLYIFMGLPGKLDRFVASCMNYGTKPNYFTTCSWLLKDKLCHCNDGTIAVLIRGPYITIMSITE